MPAGQASEGRQLDWFAVVVCIPGAHVVHWRSAVVLPSVLTYVPAAQSLHGVHAIAFDVLVNVPLAHAAQVWSAVALPSATTRSPGPQSVHATHAVAALASLSHVPLAHACFVASPPGQ